MTPVVGQIVTLKSDQSRGFRAGQKYKVKRVDTSDSTVILTTIDGRSTGPGLRGSDSTWINWSLLDLGVDWETWIKKRLSDDTNRLLSAFSGDYSVQAPIIDKVFYALDHTTQVDGLMASQEHVSSSNRKRNGRN
jgi:hypothetical protein